MEALSLTIDLTEAQMQEEPNVTIAIIFDKLKDDIIQNILEDKIKDRGKSFTLDYTNF